MMDALMVVVTGAFFAGCLAYLVGCERLQRDDGPR